MRKQKKQSNLDSWGTDQPLWMVMVARESVSFAPMAHEFLQALHKGEKLGRMPPVPHHRDWHPLKTAWAQDPPWRMPWKPLWKRLKERANHRVILSDRDEEMALQLKPRDLPTDASFKKQWTEFNRNLEWDKSRDALWIDYTFPGTKIR